jgi:hypothetical protein
MLSDILACGVEGLIRFVLYTIILWIMIKIQKFNYNWPGLLLVSGASIAISYVPWAGVYLSYPVLVFGLHTLTRASIAPDIIFTVGITRAVMFVVQLFLIGSLMGDLRPDLSANARTDEDEEVEMADTEDTEEEEATSKPASTNAFTLIGSTHPKAKDLTLRGVSINSSKALAIVSTGRSFQTISTGEWFTVQSGAKIRCDEITKSFVLLTIDDADQIRLRLP